MKILFKKLDPLAAIRERGKTCKAKKGCKCLARCYRAFNRWWMEKASVCTHPNWAPADDEWWDNTPPLVGHKPRPIQPKQSDNCRPTLDEFRKKLKQGTMI